MDNRYKIKFIYDTGDSFSTQDGVVGYIDYEFSSLGLAKQALARMKEHYLWRLSEESAWREDSKPVPNWYKPKSKRKSMTSDWYFNTMGNDEEEVWLYGGTYLGYFETLVSAEIITLSSEDDDVSFEI